VEEPEVKPVFAAPGEFFSMFQGLKKTKRKGVLFNMEKHTSTSITVLL
jgi:hypothetical protein